MAEAEGSSWYTRNDWAHAFTLKLNVTVTVYYYCRENRNRKWKRYRLWVMCNGESTCNRIYIYIYRAFHTKSTRLKPPLFFFFIQVCYGHKKWPTSIIRLKKKTLAVNWRFNISAVIFDLALRSVINSFEIHTINSLIKEQIMNHFMKGTDNGAPTRRRDSGWRSKSLRIGHSVKDIHAFSARGRLERDSRRTSFFDSSNLKN